MDALFAVDENRVYKACARLASQLIDKFESTPNIALGARSDTEPVSRATNVEIRNYYAASPGGPPGKDDTLESKSRHYST